MFLCLTRGNVKQTLTKGKLSVLDYSGFLHTTYEADTIDEKADAKIKIKVMYI